MSGNKPTDTRVTDQRLQELIGGYDDQQSDGSWNRDLLAALRELQRVRKGKDWSWPEQPSEPEVAIGGDTLPITLFQFESRAMFLLTDEQKKSLPDNALIDFICNAVRLARENERLAKLPIAPASELAWLVERRDPPTPRWAFFDELGSFGWTTNANDALRFARKIDAERFCGDMTADVMVCEHMWCAGPPPTKVEPS